jgi:hypothetical protein
MNNIPPDRDVKLLMQKNQFDISALEQSLSTLLSEAQRGELIEIKLMCLRFILSSDGNISKATERLQSYIEWRFKSMQGQQVYACVKESTFPAGWETMKKYSAIGFHGRSKTGDFLFVIRAGLSNGKALMSALSQDKLVQIMIFNRARMMQICDAETLKTGRLTKFITINDLAHTSISKMSGPFNSVLTQTAKLSEIYFPQLLDTAVLIHMPSAMRVIFSSLKRLLPKKVQSKIRVCGAIKGEAISKCPWARLHLAPSSIPSFLGGECRCPQSQGCIEGIDNDQKVAHLMDSDDGLKQWTISRGKRYEVFVPVTEPGSILVWQVQVDAGTLSSGSVILEACLRNSSEVLMTLIDKREVKPDHGSVSGEVTAHQPGTIVLSLTNTSSIWSRGVRYSVDIINPRGTVEERTEDDRQEENNSQSEKDK